MKPARLAASKDFPFYWVERLNWLLSLLLTTVVWFRSSLFMTGSVFLGCLVANVSFVFLKRDLISFLQGDLLLSGRAEKAKRLFYLKYYARLVVIALVLFTLVSKQIVDPRGLLVGLSVVVFSIGLTVAGQIKKVYFSAKEV